MARLGQSYIWRIILYVEVTHVNENNTSNLEVGKYEFIHFVNQDVFAACPTKPLYGKTDISFHIN